MLRKPIVTIGDGFINLSWSEIGLRVVAENAKPDGTAELQFFDSSREYPLIFRGRVNLLSPSQTEAISRRFGKREGIDWPNILTQITDAVVSAIRCGEPLIELWPEEQTTLEVTYLLRPLLYYGHPNVIFGDFGSLKSMVALVIAYVVQLPYHENCLGLTPMKEATKCLYLDYEDEEDSFRRRWGALQRGFGIQAAMPILYRRMSAPLADCSDQVRHIIRDNDIKLLLVDSLGPAARGNLSDPEPAIRYHETVRQFGISNLTLAHTAKDQITKRRTIYGSVFFTNSARSIWEARAEHADGEDEAIISLTHVKANLSRRHPSLSFRFTFTEDKISVVSTKIEDTAPSGRLSLAARIIEILKRGARTTQDIAFALEASEASIRTVLNRMADRKQIIKIGSSWGLKTLP